MANNAGTAALPTVASELLGAWSSDPRLYVDPALPPLVISKEEVDQMVAIVDESLSVAEQEFGFA